MSIKTKRSLIDSNDSFTKYEPIDAISNWHDKKKEGSPSLVDILNRVESLQKSLKKLGVFSGIHLSAAGFRYTGHGDTARCDDCGLETSNWTSDMNPYNIHSIQRPDCPFVRTITPSSSLIAAVRNTPVSNEQQNTLEYQSIELVDINFLLNSFFEPDSLQQVRRRTFSHWPHRTVPSSAQMIEAGFFNCNVGDRVICLYCNLICQKWTPDADDPCEVHKIRSPNCIYVKGKLIRPPASSIIILNESSTTVVTNNHLPTSNNHDPLRSNEIVFPVACNPTYAELPKRHVSFATWPNENLPSVDALARAGFFYTGRQTIVRCFYCNGSLPEWGPEDNPMIRHARWFPHCAYAKQLCGPERYRKIQAKRAQQERARANEAKEKASGDVMLNTNPPTNRDVLAKVQWTFAIGENLIGEIPEPQESTLSRLVADRLDLPISQWLLNRNFKRSIIKRCWEDQLRLKQDDFVCELDLYVACSILRKQSEHIDGKKENIVIPSIKMKQIREQNEARMHEQITNTNRSISNITDVGITTSSQTSDESTSKSTMNGKLDETKTTKQSISATHDQQKLANSTLSDPCVLCLAEKKTLAHLPCGHLATCVPCGHSLQLCPICRQKIKAFVKISI